MAREAILECNNLVKEFNSKGGKKLVAVDDVSFQIRNGEVFSLVGESGSGKTTTGKTAIGMFEANGGESLYKGKNVHSFTNKEKKEFTKEVQMIFQDPYSSLDPTQNVYDVIAEGLRIHKLVKNKDEEKEKVFDLLKTVGLNSEHAYRTSVEFSGGQRQRISIARALSVDPTFLVCDEPISALDVSIQAQIVNLLLKLKQEYSLTMLFISHDLSMVRFLSDRVGVMYLGELVEVGLAEDLYLNAKHPYTRALINSMPIVNPDISRHKKRETLEGEVPSMIDKPIGCPFYNRCELRMDICKEFKPMEKHFDDIHMVKCFLYTYDKKEQIINV